MAMIVTVFVFILFDVCTGFIKALYKGNVDSTILRQGLYRKVTEIVCVAGLKLLEYGLEYWGVAVNVPILTAGGVYICITEGISILENIGEVFPPLGDFLKKFLKKLKGENDGDEKGN